MKLTDEQIIKALECHIGKDDKRCEHCAYTIYGCDCLEKLHFALADLISRQKSEIEAYKHYYNECLKDLKNAHKTAINEFAERLKNEIISDTAYGCDTNQHSGYYDYTIKIGDIPEYIDNLVNEMVGE